MKTAKTIAPVAQAEASLARACVQLRAHQINEENIGWSAEDLKAELAVLGVHKLADNDNDIDLILLIPRLAT